VILFPNCTDSSGRRSSAYTAGRPSSIGFLSQTGSQVGKDPRPVNNKQYMAKCQRNILDYLISANYPIPISLKTLQVPTSKDFGTIFKFLYNRMDPNYQFVKKIEDDVFLCLKALKYAIIPCLLIIDTLSSIQCPNPRFQRSAQRTPGLEF
jgi:kinetochore protein NDC80